MTLASMAKLFVKEMGHKVGDESLQIYGGAGLIKRPPIEGIYRNRRSLCLAEGASEIHEDDHRPDHFKRRIEDNGVGFNPKEVITGYSQFITFDGLVRSRRKPEFVIPAEAGIQETQLLLDPRFRGGDGFSDFLRSRHF